MNSILRSLIVWLVLLAVPFQGFASAAMLACGTGHAAPAALGMTQGANAHAHDHVQVDAQAHGPDHGTAHGAPQSLVQDMSGHAHASMAQAGHDAPDASGHGNAHACSACSACSIGAAIASNLLPALAVHAAPLLSVPFAEGHVPSVHLALPERPPRSLLA